MNKVILIGNITADAAINEARTVARYSIAVPRFGEGTDFINCVCFGKQIDFAEKFVKKGKKLAIEGRIQTGSYEKDGQKIKTSDVVVEHHEFVDSKKTEEVTQSNVITPEFMNVPEGIEEDLPFN